ncbi:MAG: FliA/WhiG family RNA polymerase sigma factor [Planctomycetes bacterium]|nr:FliA/WhiG family RNA polymerase sigma factor [Planctomycetota bacterium]
MNAGTSGVAGPMPAKALRAKASKAYEAQSREPREQEWILAHLPLVRHVVQRITANLSRPVDAEELIAAGTLGLVRAARAFDPGKHAEFQTYAYIRIRGAILDELRGRSFAPPAVHRDIRRIRQAYQALLAETGSAPEDEALAARAGLPLEKLYQTLQDARRQHFLSIHGLTDEEPALEALLPADDSAAPEPEVERRELLQRLAGAIQDLAPRDRQMLLLYYERDLTMKEVAEVLGVTESRVSQMHAAALFRLSMKLKERRR